jgi:aerobic C4-dicarboxylate transport protein
MSMLESVRSNGPQKQRTSNVDPCGKVGKVKCPGNSRAHRYSMERAGCRKSVVCPVVPLSALFIAQACNIRLSVGDGILLLCVGMLISKGTAGVPGAGFIALAATSSIAHSIPMAGMALIPGIDRLLNACRAVTNFIGNAVAVIVISRRDSSIDRERLKRPLDI